MPRRSQISLVEEPPHDCEVCCCCLCQVWLFLCCCKKMKRSLRTKLLWIYTLITGLILGIVTGVVIFGASDVDFSPTDMRLMNEKLSVVFCDSVDIESTSGYLADSGRFSAFLLMEKPTIDKSSYENYNTTAANFVVHGDYDFEVFHFLEGSEIRTQHIVDSYFDLKIIKGKKSYEQFVNNDLSFDGTDQSPFAEAGLFEHSRSNIFHWSFIDTDDYYFVYINRVKDSWLRSEYHIKRTVYDTSMPLSSCTRQTFCSLDLEFSQPIYLVVHLGRQPHDDMYPDTLNTVETNCNARSWMYVLIFLGAPMVVCLFLSIAILRLCSDPVDEVRHYETSGPGERSPLLWNWEIQGPTGIVQPPKYEDIVRTAGNDLPSYEEAVATNAVNGDRT